MVLSAKKRARDDLYPASDDMGEHEIQRLIAELLRPLLARFLAEHARPGEVAHVGADQFIYWQEGKPGSRLAPDVYVLPGIDPDIAIRSWKIWETGVVPSLAFEIVGDDVTKDYEDGPAQYDELGVEELVVFDPHATATSRTRVRFQVFRRLKRRGLVRVDATQGDRVRSKVLGAWIRAVGHGDAVRLRLGLGPEGQTLYPTEAEAERAAKESERAAKESERAAREAERAGRLAAEAEVARLRALLRKPR
ncbi:MAG TPA: Uma2 family endonuclease [Polyangiaceae bacterium]|nr:Uma2 family endonuclease [Polyangiaceae bacterium]